MKSTTSPLPVFGGERQVEGWLSVEGSYARGSWRNYSRSESVKPFFAEGPMQ